MNLELFTAKEDTRYELSKVFVKNGYKCATDGRVAVRIKCDEPDTEGNFPDLNECLEKKTTFPGPVEIEKPSVEANKLCEKCHKGKIGYDFEICSVCEGSSECQCTECENIHECEHCRGEGGHYTKNKTCHYCDGSMNKYEDLEINGRFYKGYYVKLAYEELPNLIAIAQNSETGMLLLNFDGGQCAIMPFSK